ncbi:hypothetical protein ACH5Y9_01090 [Methylomonas sp. BW4-1]|uniref:hypothetical protein n=1 Tax=Methylomonas sp. BW4-1 TaxID=3376685 RepID=UPI00404278AB
MDDKQLERLYDYTKFHIGIYLSFAGGLGAFISAAGKPEQIFLRSMIGFPWAIILALLFMVGAGMAGGIIATSTIESKTYSDFRSTLQGAYGIKPFLGETWVAIEHASFWLSLFFLAIGIFSAEDVRKWVF